MKKLSLLSLGLLLLFQVSCNRLSPDSTVRIRLAQDPESLHPLTYGNAPALQILNLVYQSLLTVNLEDRAIQPLLAAELPSVRITDSLSYFTYAIRPQARWDNGTPITAHDVAFSLKILHSPLLENERWRAQYDFIQDIVYSKDSLLNFTLVCSGYTPEMKLLTGDFFVLPAHQFDPNSLISDISYKTIRGKYDSLSQSPSFKNLAQNVNQSFFARDTAGVKGSGPYRLASWKTGQHVVLEKKKGWWGSNISPTPEQLRFAPERISYQIIPDNAAAVLALKAQQLDLMDNIPLVSFKEMRQDPKFQEKFNFFSPATYDIVFLGMNGASPLLQDRLTRQAITHLINIPQVIATLQGGFATPTVGLVHPLEKDYYNKGLQPVTFDTTAAKNLLRQAGWKKADNSGWTRNQNGQQQKLVLNLMHRAGNSEFENMSLLLQQNAMLLGIPIEVTSLESSQISEKLQNRNYHLYFRTLTGNPFSYNLLSILHSSSAQGTGGNVTNFGTPETDKILEQIATVEKEEQKAILLKDLQAQMQKESNLVFLYFLQNKMAIAKRVKSPVVSSLKPNYDISTFEITE